jgi:NAD dependent epimerase/dehydratase
MEVIYGRRVLITGAGGFIGSHLAERLVELGAHVRALVRYASHGRRGWLDKSPLVTEMEVVAGDITDRDSIANAVSGADVVLHLAALIAIPYSYQAPTSYVHVNIGGTLNLLQAARAAGVGRFVHTSTSETYGTAQRTPIDEQHPLVGQSPYAASKIGADKIAEAFHRSYGLPVVVVRPFNTFGPRQSTRAIVPTLITQILVGGPIKIGNLRPTRDLNFVIDIVDGFVAAARVPDAVGETINLASGREISIGDLATLIGRLLDKPVELQTSPERFRPAASEVERLIGDASRARELLGWSSSIGLEDGLRRTAAWITEHRDDYRIGAYVL